MNTTNSEGVETEQFITQSDYQLMEENLAENEEMPESTLLCQIKSPTDFIKLRDENGIIYLTTIGEVYNSNGNDTLPDSTNYWADKIGDGNDIIIIISDPEPDPNKPIYTPGTINYFMYDHLGNTRVVHSASWDAALNSGTGALKTELKGVYDYYPYGKILRKFVSTTSGKDERYLTTGHERDKETISENNDGTGLDNRGARFYDSDVARFLSLDPAAMEYPSLSDYNYVAGNPVMFIDPDGRRVDNFVFNECGDFVRIDENDQPDKIVIENSGSGSVEGTYDFNDPVNDPTAIRNGDITNVAFISGAQISKQMVDNGSTTAKNPWTFIERESRPLGDKSLLSGTSNGFLDHVSTSPLVQSNTLHLIKGNGSSSSGTGFNDYDFGNFLWGQAGKQLGFSVGTLQGAAHLNNAVNGRSDNPGVDTGILDSPGDQRAVRQGYFYPNGEPSFTPSFPIGPKF